jgi:hypothetical protein
MKGLRVVTGHFKTPETLKMRITIPVDEVILPEDLPENATLLSEPEMRPVLPRYREIAHEATAERCSSSSAH